MSYVDKEVDSVLRFEEFSDGTPLVADSTELCRVAAEEGYLFFRGLIDPEPILQARAKVVDACREIGWLAEGSDPMDGIARSGIRAGAYDDPDYIKLISQVVPSPEIARLGRHTQIIDVLEKLFGGPVLDGQGDVCRIMGPGQPDLTTPAHQDRFYFQGAANLWTVWLPLGDCPIDLGGLAVLPGSHKQGLRDHAGERVGPHITDLAEDVTWSWSDYNCGDVLMFNNLTIHRAGENRTADRLRISADFRFRPERL